eukprot:IDg3061t1
MGATELLADLDSHVMRNVCVCSLAHCRSLMHHLFGTAIAYEQTHSTECIQRRWRDRLTCKLTARLASGYAPYDKAATWAYTHRNQYSSDLPW